MGKILNFILAICLFSGCATHHGLVVGIYQKDKANKWYSGTGAVVGPNHIMTANHVVDESDKVKLRIYGRTYNGVVIRRINSNLEPFSIIATEYDFSPDEIYEIETDLFARRPCRIETRVRALFYAWRFGGDFIWDEYKVIGGDSGSPVLNRDNKVIGVVYGHEKGNRRKPVYIRVWKVRLDEWP